MWTLANMFGKNCLPVYLNHYQLLQGMPWYEDVYPARIVCHIQVTVYEYLQVFHVSGGEVPEPAGFSGVAPKPRARLVPQLARLATPASGRNGSPSSDGAHTHRGGCLSGNTFNSGLHCCIDSFRTHSSDDGRPNRRTEVSVYMSRILLSTSRSMLCNCAHKCGISFACTRHHANNNGNEFCVSWWGRGNCFTNCSRAAAHGPFANAVERGRLLEHVRAHLTTASASPAAAPGT